MAKIKTTFICQSCGATSPKWIGKCPTCNEWNSYVEEVTNMDKGRYKPAFDEQSILAKPVLISELETKNEQRINVQNGELNRVLGGGLVPGSVVLIGGEPGIGKSTLILQLALQLKNLKTLYISGEESQQQIKLRADRIYSGDTACYVLSETLLENIFIHIKAENPDRISHRRSKYKKLKLR